MLEIGKKPLIIHRLFKVKKTLLSVMAIAEGCSSLKQKSLEMAKPLNAI